MNKTLNVAVWKRLFGYPPEGIFVVIDPQVGGRRGQLRALPLLVELGLEKYTFTTSWHRFQFVPYEHLVVHEDIEAKDLWNGFPAVQFISQTTEERSPSDVTKKLLMAQQTQAGNPLLVFVLESERFMLRQSTGGKGFVDEYDLKRVYSYESIFHRYCKIVELPTSRLSTGDSLNLMFHRLALEIDAEKLVLRLADLFDYSSLRPTSWAWDLLEQLAAQKSVRRDDRTIARFMRSWIDSDITKVTDHLLAAVQRFDYNPARIKAYRRQMIKQNEEGDDNVTN